MPKSKLAIKSSTGVLASGGKPPSFWKDLKDKFPPPEIKQAPEPIVQRLSWQERLGFIVGIENKSIEVTSGLLNQIKRFAFEDAIEILSAVQTSIENPALIKRACGIQNGFVKRRFGPEVAQAYERINLNTFAGHELEFNTKIDSFPDDQRQFLLERMLFRGRYQLQAFVIRRFLSDWSGVRDLYGSIERNFYSRDYDLCKKSFDLVAKLPKFLWPGLVSKVFSSHSFYYSIFSDALKLVSQLDDEKERESLFSLAASRLEEVIQTGRYGQGKQQGLTGLLPLFPEAQRIRLFNEILSNPDSYLAECAFKYLDLLPESYKTEQFWKRCAKKFKGRFKNCNDDDMDLDSILTVPSPFPPKIYSSLLLGGAKSDSIAVLLSIAKKTSKLRDGKEKEKLWRTLANNEYLQVILSQSKLTIDRLSMLALFPEEYRVKLLVNSLGNCSEKKPAVAEKIIELMNSIVGDVSQVAIAALESENPAIANAALNLRERIPPEQEEAFVRQAIVAHREEVCMAGLTFAISLPEESKLKLLASAMEARFPDVRKKALNYALSLDDISRKALSGILDSSST